MHQSARWANLILWNRVLTKMASAKVEITLRAVSMSGPCSNAMPIPLETFRSNKEMGRVLLRRGGETIAAGQYDCLLRHVWSLAHAVEVQGLS